jgi:hypothetical protein
MRTAIALGALALGSGGFTVTTPPRPAFPGPGRPSYAPNALALVSSRYQAPGNLENDTIGAPANTFRGLPGQELISTPNRTFGIYGKDGSTGRYLVAYDKRGRALYAFDFKNYVWPPRIRAGERDFVYEAPVWAQEVGDTLYVENAHSTYARSSYGQNAYITAIDLRTKRARWRSPPLVANARNFLVTPHYLITGYGFTKEPDYLFALDRKTGNGSGIVKLPTAPEKITRQGSLIHVRTYDHVVVVRLKGGV